MTSAAKAGRAMVVTDLDGTLFNSSGRLSPANRDTLTALGDRNVLRVVATGRNLYSALKALPEDLPLDYLVFASGAGTLEWRSRELLEACHLDDAEAIGAAARLVELGLDFMLHHGVPDNHRFWYHRTREDNADFERRLSRYEAHCEPWPVEGVPTGPFSQLLAVEAPDSLLTHEALRDSLAPLNVIRATSPLDHRSYWWEVFPEGVSKAAGARFIMQRHRVAAQRVLAIGNDFNDEELLSWAAEPRVVANAPPELLRRYPRVGSNDADGFTQAVTRWLSGIDSA